MQNREHPGNLSSLPICFWVGGVEVVDTLLLW